MEPRFIRTINDYFPYPIAANFKVLMTDECMDAGPLRLQYLLRTAESVARFLGMVLLLECRRYIEANSEAPLSPIFQANYENPASVPGSISHEKDRSGWRPRRRNWLSQR